MSPAITKVPRALVAVACLLGAGCGPSGGGLVPVAGTVTYKGRPVRAGQIVFEDASQGVALAAPLRADGSYTVRTAEGDGLPPGTYKVSITVPPAAGTMGFMAPSPNAKASDYPDIPRKYHRPETSGLTADVRRGSTEAFNYDMQD